MTAAHARVNEHTLVSATVHVPAIGPWWAEVVFEEAPEVSGQVSLWIGGTELVGTIEATHDGVTGLQRRSRIVAGAGGWGELLAARAYHNDAQIRARTVAEDAAREAGEVLGDFAPAAERIGVDYVRQAGPASRVLEDVIGGAPWWVAYDGRTHVGARASAEASGYEVLEVEPASRVVTLAADEIDGIRIGYTLDGEQLDAPLTIAELTIRVTEEGVRVRAWCGDAELGSQGRLVRALRSIVGRLTDRQLLGPRKYRVVRRSADRVELQVVRRSQGLPDILPISMWPGVAGAHAELTEGAEVLVQWIDGDRTQPIVTHFAGKDGVGWTPANLTIDVTTLMKLGQNAAEFVALAEKTKARIDTLQQAHDSHTHAVTGTADLGTGAVTGTAAVTAAPIGALASVAATKVKAE